MPIVSENFKKLFEIINKKVKNNFFKENENITNLKDFEILGLFPDAYIDKGMQFIDDEFQIILAIPHGTIHRYPHQPMKSLELMSLLYQTHGFYRKELKTIKYYQKVSDIKQCLEDKNYGLACEAFYHMKHDTKTVIPSRSIDVCQRIVINDHSRKLDNRFFIIDLAKIMFATMNPEYDELLENILILRNKYQTFFESSSLDSYLSRSFMLYYTYILQIKAERFNVYNKPFNRFESAMVIKKIAIKALEYIKKKNSKTNILSGSYETLFYMWTFINSLLSSLHIISEMMTIMGIDRESKRYQYEFLRMSVMYCVPSRTKYAIKLMMHNDFINQRIPELTIRDTQLYFLKTNDKMIGNSFQLSYRCMSSEPDMEEFNIPVSVKDDFDYFGDEVNIKSHQKPQCLYINTRNEGEKLVSFEECYLNKCLWRAEFVDIFKVIKTYIWKLNNEDIRFFDDNKWESMFLQPKEDVDELSEIFKDSISLLTPTKIEESKVKCLPINAPLRAKKRQQIGRAKINCGTRNNNKNDIKYNADDGEDIPIESCSTVVIPYKARNIHYEMPEVSRSKMYDEPLKVPLSEINHFEHSQSNNAFFQHDASNSPLGVYLDNSICTSGNRTYLIEYLQNHVNTFKFMSIPILHRPIFQRLALNYMSKGEKKRAAYNLSMAINIGFRQSYQHDCNIKIRAKNEDSKRWTHTADVVNHCLTSEANFYTILNETLPNNWTILQLSMIDEIPMTSVIKSSLLDGQEGGCLGARNVAVMVASKFQKKNNLVTVENRVIHGFKITGLQLMDHFEKLKMDNVQSMNITDRKTWWLKRKELDLDTYNLINQMRKDWFTEEDLEWLLDDNQSLGSEPKILITDRHISRLPIESILSQIECVPRCFSRMPNVICLLAHLTQVRFRKVDKITSTLRRVNLEVDPSNTFFLVNPDSSLPETEDTLLPMFKEILGWEGISGKNGLESLDCMKMLNKKDMTIYCGHGSGSKYFSEKSLKQLTSSSALFLLGCYSARFNIDGRSEANSNMMNYLNNGCPTILGLMWDVTDREIDKFTQQLLSGWLTNNARFANISSETYNPVAPLSAYINNKDTSEGLRLKTLTGKSSIIFGLPLWIDPNATVSSL